MLEQAPGRSCGHGEEPTQEQVLLTRAVACGRPMLEEFMKNCSPWEGPTLEQFMKNCLLWEGPHTGAGEEHEEEGTAETKCYRLTTTPIPHPPVPFQGEEVEKSGVKLSPGRREEWGEGVLRFGFISYYPTRILISNKLN